MDEQHLLGDSVGGVRLFRVPVPEIALEKWNRRELRVRANRADADELLDAGGACLLHDHRAHHHVFVEEPAGRLPVGADAADDRGEMNDDLRFEIGVHAADVRLVRQVVVRFAGRGERTAVAPRECSHHMAAEKTVAAGDEDALASKITHSSIIRSPIPRSLHRSRL